MVIPAVGVVVGNDDRGVLPIRAIHDGVDGAHDKSLLIERIGITRVAIKCALGLEIGNRGKPTLSERRIEKAQIVLVVGLVGFADLGQVARRQVGWIRRRRIVLKRFVMGNVVMGPGWRGQADARSAARGRSVGVRTGEGKSTSKPAPSDVLLVQQVAHVRARHGDAGGLRCTYVRGRQAIVIARAWVADQRAGSQSAGDGSTRVASGYAIGSQRNQGSAARVAGNEVNGADARRAEVCAIGVIAHGEVLGVVPKAGEGAAVVIAHHDAGSFARVKAVARGSGQEWVAMGVLTVSGAS